MMITAFLLIVAVLFIYFYAIRPALADRRRMKRWTEWRSPFPEEDGYTEYDIRELFHECEDLYREDDALARKKYEGKKVILKATVLRIYHETSIEIKDIGEKSPWSHVYMDCSAKHNKKARKAIRHLEGDEKNLVYVKGRIRNSIGMHGIDVDDIAVYGG